MILYKFVAPYLWEYILNSNLIRFTQASALNDPFEIQALYSLLSQRDKWRGDTLNALTDPEEYKSVIRSLPSLNPNIPPDFISEDALELLAAWATSGKPNMEVVESFMDGCDESMHEAFVGALDKTVGILSLTENFESLLMWGHYACSHKGLVIGFDTTHPFFNQRQGPTDPFGFPRKVDYREDRVQVAVDRIDELEDLAPALLFKSPEWEDEREWRMMLRLQGMAKTEVHNGEAVHLFSFPHECVVRVILGNGMPTGQKETIKDFIFGDLRYAHVRLEEVSLDPREFKLNFTEIKRPAP